MHLIRRPLVLALGALLLVTAAGCRKPAADSPAPPAAADPAPEPQPQPQPNPQPPLPAAACQSPQETAVWTGAPGQAPPPGPAGTPQQPGIGPASVSLTESDGFGGGAWLGDKLLTGGSGVAVVGTDRFVVHIQLQPAPEPAWFSQHVAVSGAAADPLRDELAAQGLVELAFPRGRAGDAVSVRLTGLTTADGTGELNLTFCRAEEPTATLEVRVGSAWQPVSPEQAYDANPLELRLRFSQPVNRASVEQALADLGQSQQVQLPALPRLEWVSDTEALLTYTDPPLVMLFPFSLTPARSQLGLWVVGNLPAVHTGPPPVIEAMVPGQPIGLPVATVPVEVTEARASPGGESVLLKSYRWFTGWGQATWARTLVNTATGQLRPLPAPPGDDSAGLAALGPDLAWRRFPWTGGAPFRTAAAPAGDRLAMLVPSPGQPPEPADYRLAYDLHVVDAAGRTVLEVPRFVWLYRPPTEWIARSDLAWSPDGSRIAALSDGREGAAALVVADLATGQAATVTGSIEGIRHGTALALSWSPDGALLAAGPALLDPATGALLARVAEDPNVIPAWSPEGGRLAWHDEPWGQAWAYEVATGHKESLGRGFVAGWDAAGRALVMRWAGAPYRFVPEYP